MNNIDNVRKIFFVGIKGVGMAALARVAYEMGKEVYGSDIKKSFITDQSLNDLGGHIFEGFSVNDLPAGIDLLVYSASHGGEDNPQVKEALRRGVGVYSYGHALSLVFADRKVLAVAGTHGKTTVSAMLATILQKANKKPSWIIGTGEIPGLGFGGHWGEGDLVVIEADEYVDKPGGKPKFLFFNPFGLIITSLDWDHVDVFPTHKLFINAFHKLLKRVDSKGVLVLKGNEGALRRLTKSAPQKIRWILDNRFWPGLKISIPGRFNLTNATFAATMAHELGVAQKDILKALANFKGTQRRMQVVQDTNKWLIIDDYAHHPTEIKATLGALREKYSGSYICVLFQPHTYSRTKAFIKDFASSFNQADEVLLAPVFASAREKESEKEIDIFEVVSQKHANVARVTSPKDINLYFKEKKISQKGIFVTMGAGDIYQWLELENVPK